MTRASSLLASMSFAVCASMLACGDLQPLLEYETDLPHASESVAGDAGSAESGGEGATSDSGGDGEPGDGDGDGSPGDGDGDGSPGDGDGVAGDGDGDGFPSPCGNGFVDDGEECDDSNGYNNDGCLANCTVPRSCLELHTFDASLPDGEYLIAPSYPAPAFQVECDMTKNGGGWTGLTLQHVCHGHLGHTVQSYINASHYDFNLQNCTLRTGNSRTHSYALDIEFKSGFVQFYLSEYKIATNANPGDDCEINPSQFIQERWPEAFGSNHGDVSFGSPDEPGPITSYAATGSEVNCHPCDRLFDANGQIQALNASSTWFRIGWGEDGGGHDREGWYPWYRGTIFVR